MMRFLIFLMCVLFHATLLSFAFAQVKKPVLMIKPSEPWCKERGYTKGGVVDYRKALQNDAELFNVVSKIGELMSKYGFPLKDMSQSLEDGDSLLQRAKADIILEVGWNLNRIGPKKSITYNIRAIDNYTKKQVGAASGTGKPSIACETMVLLEEAVLENMDAFQDQLTRYFEDLGENGREIILTISMAEGDSISRTFNKEIDGETIADIIDEWIEAHTVGHRYQIDLATDKIMRFVQVRIPLQDMNGIALDARKFLSGLRKFLLNKDVKSKINSDGLGKADLIIQSIP